MFSGSSILRVKYNAKAEAQKSQKSLFLAAFEMELAQETPSGTDKVVSNLELNTRTEGNSELKTLRCSINAMY